MDEKGQFRELAIAMKPVLEQMETVLENHGVRCYARVAMNNGYLEFSHQNTPWEMKRIDAEHSINIVCEIKEEL